MRKSMKHAIKEYLMARLEDAWVLCSADVECDSGSAGYMLDISLHTGQFIYGGINIGSYSGVKNALRKFGIEQKTCRSIEDIDDCVAWAVHLQEIHMLSKAVSMVA